MDEIDVRVPRLSMSLSLSSFVCCLSTNRVLCNIILRRFGDHFVVRSLTCDDVYSSAAVSIDVCGALNPNSGKSGVCAMRR